MDAKYRIGQQVTIRPVKDKRLPPKDADIEQYAGRVAKVTNYYWIQPAKGKTFYIYTVRIGEDMKEIVVHEDELSAY